MDEPMLRVMIVEDDKLARWGIISLMPWERYGMAVVAEAANGAAALEALERVHVDLLVTDIEMPVVSGVELIRAVRKLYPAMHIAVLTLHQDFSYVREALRLGVVDYIAKTDLEQESFDKVLARISERIASTGKASSPASVANDYAAMLFCRRIGDFPAPSGVVPMKPHEEVSPLIWMWPEKSFAQAQETARLLELAQKDKEGCCLAVMSGISECNAASLAKLLESYRCNALFYGCSLDRRCMTKTVQELKADNEREDYALAEALRLRWLFPNWVFLDDALASLHKDTKNAQIPKAMLFAAASRAVQDLYQLFASGGGSPYDAMQDFYCYEQFEHFTYDLARRLRPKQYEAPSREIVDCICCAVDIISEDFGNPLQAESIAYMVHMSRSYFFRQFKAMLGVTFNDYVRSIRICRAKEYLKDPAKSVSSVAHMVGYLDEKYFSQVFKSITGLMPKEYRKRGGAAE